jgi:hypothetical protein
MSCGGSMMRTNLQPLAHLVDAAAEKWLAVADAAEQNQQSVRDEITASFRIGDNPELTFHGLRYQLCISRIAITHPDQSQAFHVHVHEIVTDN